MITFDRKGLLTPNREISCTLLELKLNFVDNIYSKTRLEIFNNYVEYSKSLKELLRIKELKQQINGSFVTKKINPKDLDFVTFINFDLFEEHEEALKAFTSNQEWLDIGIDAYIIKVYPVEHELYSFYQGDKSYWIDKFDKTRRNNRTGVKSSKGFLEIIY